MSIDKLEQEHPVHVRWRAFPLRPNLPPGGLPLEDMLDADPDEAWAMARSLQDTAAEFGLPFGELKRVSNSRLAQELAAWADSVGKARPFHEALFQAFFVEGKDIGDKAVLVDLAGAVGLDRDQALQALEERLYRKAVDADWARARQLGIRMAPTFVMKDRLLEGTKPYPVLEAWFREEGLWEPMGNRPVANPSSSTT